MFLQPSCFVAVQLNFLFPVSIFHITLIICILLSLVLHVINKGFRATWYAGFNFFAPYFPPLSSYQLPLEASIWSRNSTEQGRYWSESVNRTAAQTNPWLGAPQCTKLPNWRCTPDEKKKKNPLAHTTQRQVYWTWRKKLQANRKIQVYALFLILTLP